MTDATTDFLPPRPWRMTDLGVIRDAEGGPVPLSSPRVDRDRRAHVVDAVNAYDEIAPIIEAYDTMAAELTEIGMMLGLPRPTPQHIWGAEEVKAQIGRLRAELELAIAPLIRGSRR